jgi:hypothetical protein
MMRSLESPPPGISDAHPNVNLSACRPAGTADTVGAAIVGDRQVIKCAAFGTSAGVIVDDLPESHMFTCAEVHPRGEL